MLWKHFVRVLAFASIAYFIAWRITRESFLLEYDSNSLSVINFGAFIGVYFVLNVLTLLLFIKKIALNSILRKVILSIPIAGLLYILYNFSQIYNFVGWITFVVFGFICYGSTLLSAIINFIIIERKFAQFDEIEGPEVLDQ